MSIRTLASRVAGSPLSLRYGSKIRPEETGKLAKRKIGEGLATYSCLGNCSNQLDEVFRRSKGEGGTKWQTKDLTLALLSAVHCPLRRVARGLSPRRCKISRVTLKWSLSLATWSVLVFAVLAVPAFGQSQLTVTNGQSVTAGPGTAVGANFSNIIVNTSGNLTGTNLTVQNANFNGSTRILLTGPATASLTNTAIALQNSTTGISAAGPK
jgi:hypothetical protein